MLHSFRPAPRENGISARRRSDLESLTGVDVFQPVFSVDKLHQCFTEFRARGNQTAAERQIMHNIMSPLFTKTLSPTRELAIFVFSTLHFHYHSSATHAFKRVIFILVPFFPSHNVVIVLLTKKITSCNSSLKNESVIVFSLSYHS